AGTGGYGKSGNPCRKPGFVLFQVDEDVLMYWRFSTHRTKYDGVPEGPDALDPRVKEYCLVKKLGKGKHEVKEMELNVAWKE
ncbi:MAG TPA: hypothetical protein VHY08_12805, partial [Bacillota bacterium]|nr:hypothetical protein [Bacillota bacterium]